MGHQAPLPTAHTGSSLTKIGRGGRMIQGWERLGTNWGHRETGSGKVGGGARQAYHSRMGPHPPWRYHLRREPKMG